MIGRPRTRRPTRPQRKHARAGGPAVDARLQNGAGPQDAETGPLFSAEQAVAPSEQTGPQDVLAEADTALPQTRKTETVRHESGQAGAGPRGRQPGPPLLVITAPQPPAVQRPAPAGPVTPGEVSGQTLVALLKTRQPEQARTARARALPGIQTAEAQPVPAPSGQRVPYGPGDAHGPAKPDRPADREEGHGRAAIAEAAPTPGDEEPTPVAAAKPRRFSFSLPSLKSGIRLPGPAGPLHSICVSDTELRILVTRGNAVLRWSEERLPDGVVRDGTVVDPEQFALHVSKLVASVRKDGKLGGRQLAAVITGRNVVQRRFAVFPTEATDLDQAIMEACAERMAIKPEELQLDWDVREADGASAADADAPRPPGCGDVVRHEVYAFGIYRHVLDANLRALASTGAKIATAQPKALTLAAAVNCSSGVIVDTEPHSLMVIVLRDGLPEVVREVGIDPGMTRGQWVTAVTTHVSRTVAFYDSLYPQEPLDIDSPLFLTGAGKTVAGSAQVGIERLPFPETVMPPVMRAAKDFPFGLFAANVGLAILSRRRRWLRTPAPLLQRPRLDFLPDSYRPKPFPVRAVATGAAAAGLAAGLVFTYQLVSQEAATAMSLKQDLGRVEKLVQLRSAVIAKEKESRARLDALKEEAQTVQAVTSFIRHLDRNFFKTVSAVSGALPEGTVLREMDDDGYLASVQAAADSYDVLLDYVAALERNPNFRDVQVRTMGAQAATAVAAKGAGGGIPGFGGLPLQQAPGQGSEPAKQPKYVIRIDFTRGSLPVSAQAVVQGAKGGAPSAASGSAAVKK